MKIISQKIKAEVLKRNTLFLILFLNMIWTLQIEGQTSHNDSMPTYRIIISKNLFSEVDLNDAAAAMNVWVKELVGTIKPEFKLEPIILNKIDELNTSFLKNTALICLNSIDYLNYKLKFNLEGAFVSLKNKQVYSEYILLTKKNIHNLDELKKAKIGIEPKYNHLISHIWLEVLLNENKLPPTDEFFKEVKEFEKESQLILSVFFGQLDACVVTKNSYHLMVELNPQIGERLKIISESPDIVLTVTCFSENFRNIEHRKRIINSAKKLDFYPGGKQILTLMNVDQVVSFRPEYMDNVKILLKDYNNIISKNKKQNESAYKIKK
jgi:ABC transporter, phosphonate, periplasmic substrate-binding protein